MARPSFVPALLVLGAALSGVAPGLELVAHAQQVPAGTAIRPRVKGRSHRLKIDSSPQQGTVYWDAGPTLNPKNYGIAGYTPITLKGPRSPVKPVSSPITFTGQRGTYNVMGV